MSKSILTNERKCWFCGTTYNLHKHHVYGGPNRKLSEKHGCWCYVCGTDHNLSNKSVHHDRAMDLELKRACQKRWEETKEEDFMKVFGRNYL